MTNYERLCKLLCGGPTAYTPSGVAQWRQAKRYGKTPAVGAFIYFYSANLGRVSHVGIVTSAVQSNRVYRITTIEGNSGAGENATAWRDGGKTLEHTYDFLPEQVGGRNRINGFGYPLFGAETCTAEQFVLQARKWLGYLEHATPDQLEDFTANVGDNNCTLFGRWYGLTVGKPATYTCAQWCSMFCCYAAYRAVVEAHDWRTPWYEDEDGWHFRKDGGSICRDEWLHYGGRWYVFDGSGRMVTGWYKAQEGYYYLAGDGALCTSQWVEDDGKNYYMTRSGLMATSCYVRSEMPYKPGKYIYYWVGEDGAWIPKWDTDEPDLRRYYCAT